MLYEKGLCASAKSFDSGQPAQPAQADLSRNFLVLVNHLHICRTSVPHGLVGYQTIWVNGFTIMYGILFSPSTFRPLFKQKGTMKSLIKHGILFSPSTFRPLFKQKSYLGKSNKTRNPVSAIHFSSYEEH